MSFSTILGLIFCNIMWSLGYSVAKHLMLDFHPMEIAFLRYSTGALPLAIYGLWKGRRGMLANWLRDLNKVDTRLIIVGLLTFFVSPFCQMTGLNLSRAVDSSLMIALEPLVTVLLACVMLRERLAVRQIIAIALAVTGACVLTELTFVKLIAFADTRLLGNLIFVLSLFSEAAYSTVAKPALDRRSPTLFMTVSILVGVAVLFGYNIVLDGPTRLAGVVPLLARHQWRDWASIAFLGFGCTTFGYLYWMKVLRTTPVSIMALTLYVQPVLGMFWGHFLLGESLGVSTYLGAALILGAVWLATRPRAFTRQSLT